MTKGVALFVKPEKGREIIGVVDPESKLRMQETAKKLKNFQYFGCEDSVQNHMIMMVNVEKGHGVDVQKQGPTALNQRVFTVECLQSAEFLTLDQHSLDKMRKAFTSVSRDFFKTMMDQYKYLISYSAQLSSGIIGLSQM